MTFRMICSMKSGARKIARMNEDVMAHLVSEYGKMKSALFKEEERQVNVCGQWFTLNDISRMVFTNEWTGEKLEIC